MNCNSSRLHFVLQFRIKGLREEDMKVNYNKLWKMLIDLNMSKTQLRKRAGVTTNALAKMGKNENVSTEVLCKICNVLSCQIEDIMELVETENCESKEI